MSSYPQYGGAPSREVLVKQATQGGFAIAGGIALLIFKGIVAIPYFGVIVGAAMLISGLVLRSKGSSGDKFTSVALIGLGAVAVATVVPVLGGLASGLMWLSGLGLIGVGIWKLIQYSRGMKGRSS